MSQWVLSASARSTSFSFRNSVPGAIFVRYNTNSTCLELSVNSIGMEFDVRFSYCIPGYWG